MWKVECDVANSKSTSFRQIKSGPSKAMQRNSPGAPSRSCEAVHEQSRIIRSPIRICTIGVMRFTTTSAVGYGRSQIKRSKNDSTSSGRDEAANRHPGQVRYLQSPPKAVLDGEPSQGADASKDYRQAFINSRSISKLWRCWLTSENHCVYFE